MVVHRIVMGEGLLRNNAPRAKRPLTLSSALDNRTALSRKGRGRNNAHRIVAILNHPSETQH